MQGDKGVGRFAVYKLGNNVEMFTKTESTPEVHLKLNFREYAQNDEFSNEDKIEQKFLDQIQNEWEVNDEPLEIKNNKKKGTLIRISDLRNSWKLDDLEKLATAFQRMIPPIIPNFKEKINRDFGVDLFWNGDKVTTPLMTFEKIIELSPYSFEGSVDNKGILTYFYEHNNKISGNTNNDIKEINLFDSEDTQKYDIWKLKFFKEQFLTNAVVGPKKNQIVIRRRPDIGEFSFFFYAFDWANKSSLKSDEEEFIKNNSVYLYRDFTRVYPYGERGIDWLMLSKLRAEDQAGLYFSYNDLIGFIFIGQKNNPKLRDAANREGLVNVEGAADDFAALIQATLKVMKFYVDLDKNKEKIKKEKAFTSASRKFSVAFEELKSELIKIDNKTVIVKAQKLFESANTLVEQYKNRLSISQELAGIGMAVEKSTHDISLLIRKIIQNANDLVSRFDKGKLNTDNLKQFFADLTESLEFLYQEIQILQPLFRVSRKTIKEISVRDAVERVQRYYRRELVNNINFKIEGDNDFIVKANLGLLLQVFINLVDNSIYWLDKKGLGKKEIQVKIDSKNKSITFGDNGVGIDAEMTDIIFLEFYTTKADGRGLGLYIVKELLDRINANISLITTDESKILAGANFLIKFSEVE